MSRPIYFLTILFVFMIVLALSTVPVDARPSLMARTAPIVIDHRHTDIGQIPEYWINQAKDLLRLSYGHTSHGSQLVTGMDAIKNVNSLFNFNTNGAISPGILSLDDYTPSGDLGNPDRVTWAALTRTYLTGPTGTGPSRNVTIWSWCGEVSWAAQADIDTYLSLMNQLEIDYPNVDFVYMTGHLDGSGEAGTLKIRNQQIRDYVIANNKVLFDFADIESYDPAGNYYPDESDACSWCANWCSSHPADCANPPAPGSCAHSHEFNCLRKGQAFWWLLARLAGWPGPDAASVTISGNAGVGGATLSYVDGTPKTVTADGSGNYSITVPYNWSGTVTPSKTYYTFLPDSRTYTNYVENLTNQDYTATQSSFDDVSTNYWAWQYIERLYGAGITGGCGNPPLNYCPDSPVTRAQMAVFLLKGIHGSSYQPPAVNGDTGFADVATNHWAAPWIKQLFTEGITGGCGTGIYCPEANVTRAQMAIFLLKAKHGSAYSPPTATGVFTDVSVNHWARNWIEQLAAEAITSGCGAGIYCPEDSVTRAQMAVFLVKTFNLP